MSENSIGKYYEWMDSEGKLWLGTWTDGIWHCLEPTKEGWIHHTRDGILLAALSGSTWVEKPNLYPIAFAVCAECDKICANTDYLCSTCRDAQDRVESEDG